MAHGETINGREGSMKRRSHPSVLRNRDPILSVLREVLPRNGTILEIASGTGEHGAYFAPLLAPGRWLPSDPDPDNRDSIEAWAQQSGGAMLTPIDIDASASRWVVEDDPPAEPITGIVAINMIHIAPWEACIGLMAAAGRILPADGILYLYGAYKIGGEHTASSNISFEEWLKSLDPRFGVRDLEAVVAEAEKNGLSLESRIAMPANNFSLVFRKT